LSAFGSTDNSIVSLDVYLTSSPEVIERGIQVRSFRRNASSKPEEYLCRRRTFQSKISEQRRQLLV